LARATGAMKGLATPNTMGLIQPETKSRSPGRPGLWDQLPPLEAHSDAPPEFLALATMGRRVMRHVVAIAMTTSLGIPGR